MAIFKKTLTEEEVKKFSEENKLCTDDLKEVSGGWGYTEDTENGGKEFWFQCSRCLEYEEFITGVPRDYDWDMQGTFKCPKCGWKRDWTIQVRDGNIRIWSPV